MIEKKDDDIVGQDIERNRQCEQPLESEMLKVSKEENCQLEHVTSLGFFPKTIGFWHEMEKETPPKDSQVLVFNPSYGICIIDGRICTAFVKRVKVTTRSFPA